MSQPVFQTAGCVVASRLSEDPDVTVAVLEAGPPHLDDPITSRRLYIAHHQLSSDPLSRLTGDPAAFLKLIQHPEYDYKYATTPQPGLGGQPAVFSR